MIDPADEEEEFTRNLYARTKNPTFCLPWSPHEGPPNMTPEVALRLFRENRSDVLSRTVMTDEQRENFVGDARPS